MVDALVNQNVDAVLNRILHHNFEMPSNGPLYPIIASANVNERIVLFVCSGEFKQNNDGTYSYIVYRNFVNDDRINIQNPNVDIYSYVPYFEQDSDNTNKTVQISFELSHERLHSPGLEPPKIHTTTHQLEVIPGELGSMRDALGDVYEADLLVGCRIAITLMSTQLDSMTKWLLPQEILKRACFDGFSQLYGVADPLQHIQPHTLFCDQYRRDDCAETNSAPIMSDEECSCYRSEVTRYHQSVQTFINQGPCSNMECIQKGYRSFHNSRFQCNHVLCIQNEDNWPANSNITMNCNGYYYEPATIAANNLTNSVNMVIDEKYNSVTIPFLVFCGIVIVIFLTFLTYSVKSYKRVSM